MEENCQSDCGCYAQNPEKQFLNYSELLDFIKLARKQGFADHQIKRTLLDNRWPLETIDRAIASLKISSSSGPQYKVKNKVEVYLTEDILKAIEKRAEKNMFNLNEQIEDILRRSCLHEKQIRAQEDKVDDLFLKLFSRKRD